MNVYAWSVSACRWKMLLGTLAITVRAMLTFFWPVLLALWMREPRTAWFLAFICLWGFVAGINRAVTDTVRRLERFP